jgi:colicin import membrane protein
MDLSKETRDRIFGAANQLYEQAARATYPTVDAVRKLAKVNMNDASTGMKEWRRAQSAQVVAVAVQVPDQVQQASNQALGSLWSVAQELANESLRAAQAGWEAERQELETLNKQLADAHEAQATKLENATRRVNELEVSAKVAGQEIEGARTALASMEQRAAVAEGRASEIERRAEVLVRELDEAHKLHARQVTAFDELDRLVGVLRQSTAAGETRIGELQAELSKAGALAEAKGRAAEDQRQEALREGGRLAEVAKQAQADRKQAVEEAATLKETLAGLQGKLEVLTVQNASLISAVEGSLSGKKPKAAPGKADSADKASK